MPRLLEVPIDLVKMGHPSYPVDELEYTCEECGVKLTFSEFGQKSSKAFYKFGVELESDKCECGANHWSVDRKEV